MKINIAIIPARGGSRRIHKKNIKNFADKPIIYYPIEAAKKSGIFNRIIVSTDYEQIAEVARKAGAEVPFMRPSELGENSVNVADVVHHAINWLKDNGNEIPYVCCIVATAPFLKPEFLTEGFHLIRKYEVDTVMSVVKFQFPVFRAFKKDENGRMRFIWPEYELVHSNDLPETYHDAAQFYWLNTEKFLKTKSIMGYEVLPVVLPAYLVRDIDTPEDWETAEIMYETCKMKGLL